jgi:hypothetical protein
MIEFLCDMAEIILKSNVVQFEGEFFLQVKGTAMGTNFTLNTHIWYTELLKNEFSRKFN